MRVSPPVTRVRGGALVVGCTLVAEDGTDLPPLEVGLARADADLLDPTATPFLPVLATVAAARGEDLLLDGPVDPHALRAAAGVADLLAERWGTGPVRVDADGELPAVPVGDGCGLFFTRGVDSWSTLLDLLELPPPERVTRLYTVFHGPGPAQEPLHAAHLAGHREVADELGLPLVALTTTARSLLDPHRPWAMVVGPALVSTGLVAGAGLRRLVVAGVNRVEVPIGNGSDPRLIAQMSTPAVEVVLGNPHRDRLERLAHIASDPLARRTLQVCWAGEVVENCGRCNKCLATASGLLAAGDPDPHVAFDDDPLDIEAIRAVRLSPADTSGLAARLAEVLPPEHEEVRRAWADVRDRAVGLEGRQRWGDDSPPPLAGPSVAERVARGVRAATGQAEVPAPRPLGWRPGAVPLRPALADHDAVRARAATVADRSRPWAVVEPHARDGRRDGRQAGLALRLQAAFGAGTCYLPGILWAPGQAPGLPVAAVARLLDGARARLWWRDEGDLDPLRVVETVERGALPLQVMPDGVALLLADELPAALAPLVVPASALGAVDLGAEAVAARLGPALDHLLLGSADRDLVAEGHR